MRWHSRQPAWRFYLHFKFSKLHTNCQPLHCQKTLLPHLSRSSKPMRLQAFLLQKLFVSSSAHPEQRSVLHPKKLKRKTSHQKIHLPVLHLTHILGSWTLSHSKHPCKSPQQVVNPKTQCVASLQKGEKKTLVSVTCCPPSHQSILLRKLLKGSKDMHPGCVTWVPYLTDDWCMGVRQSPMQRNPSLWNFKRLWVGGKFQMGWMGSP